MHVTLRMPTSRLFSFRSRQPEESFKLYKYHDHPARCPNVSLASGQYMKPVLNCTNFDMFPILFILPLAFVVASAMYLPTSDGQLVLGDNKPQCELKCGYYGQLCCSSGETCYTDSNDQAQCGPPASPTTASSIVPTRPTSGTIVTITASATVPETVTITFYPPTSTAIEGSWQMYTTTYVQTAIETVIEPVPTFLTIVEERVASLTIEAPVIETGYQTITTKYSSFIGGTYTCGSFSIPVATAGS